MLLASWWWILLALTSWIVLGWVVNKRLLRVFGAGGIYSVLLAIAAEGVIRSHFDYFHDDRLLLPFLGADLLLFIGPRFVEGVMFMITMGPSFQLSRIFLWTVGVTLSETAGSFWSFVNFSPGGLALATTVHAFRFLSLLAFYHAGGFAQRQQLLKQRDRWEIILDLSKKLWPVSGTFFLVVATVARKAASLAARTPKRLRP